MHCPSDGESLRRFRIAKGRWAWGCGTCQGHAITLAVIRHQLHEDYRRKLIERMHESDMPSRHRCPACEQTMRVLGFDIEDESVELDLCRTCSLVWFDRGELEAAPPAGPTREQLREAEREAERTPEQRIALANAEARLAFAAAERDQQREGPTAATALPAFFGLPVEIGGNQSSEQPWATWILAVLVTAVTAAAFADEQLLRTLALVPNDAIDRPLTLLTAFFVHGEWLHLIGNLWFFVVFGDNIEQHYGRARWLLLVVLATLAGSVMHILVDPGDTTPCVGASGGISGLIMCYALTLPHARLGMFLPRHYAVRRSLRPHWVTFSARSAAILWLGIQLYYATLQLSGLCAISAFAHLGGAAAGATCWWLWRDKEDGGARKRATR